MHIPSDDEEEDDEEDEDVAVEARKCKTLTDSFGNTVAKGSSTDPDIAKLRAVKAAAREAKRIAKLGDAGGGGGSANGGGADGSSADGGGGGGGDDELSALRAKEASGAKLSNKEKKLLKKAEGRAARYAEEEQADSDPLRAFSLSVTGSAEGCAEDDKDGAGVVSATDVIVRGFSIAAPARKLLTDTSLKLASGRRYGLLGPNGRGKSTLLRFLAARRLPVPRGVDVLLVEQEVLADDDTSVVDQVLSADKSRLALLAEEAALTQEVEEVSAAEESVAALAEAEEDDDGDEGGIKEDTEGEGCEGEGGAPAAALESLSLDASKRGGAAWWSAKLARLAAVGEALDAMGADAAEGTVRGILTGLGFTDAMMEGPSTLLSGGWRMRVSLARALFVRPRLLLLDEPTNHLDLDAVIWLEEHLARHWRGTLLIVSHDAIFLDEVCTDVIHLDDEKLNQYGGNVTQFNAMRGQINSAKERDYALQEKTIKNIMQSKGLNREKAEKAALGKLTFASAVSGGLLARPKEYKVKFAFKDPESTVPTVSMLDVAFGYARSQELFRDLRFKVDTDSRIAIVGANGSGKTTLLKLVTGQLAPTRGEVSHHRHLVIGRYDQHFDELLPMDKSGVEFLRGAYDLADQEARKYLGMFGLDGARHLIKLGDLSGGQKARVVLASLALQRPHILVLDEPTNHLDMER